MSLKDLLLRQIAADGPMRLDHYMHHCLMHPEFGYYITKDPLGAAGDFTTAPEISQMFGELLGLALAQTWADQGGGPCAFVELGPGRGTLMADMLRATIAVPGFSPDVHLIETSPSLREVQRTTLAGHSVTWHEAVETLPQTRLFVIANEFFDALPIRQFVRQGRGWAERLVGEKGGMLHFGLSAPVPMEELAHRLTDTKDKDIVELCQSLGTVVGAISDRISKHGGAAVFIDYGDWRSLGDTFQAVQNHKACEPLDSPGQADLTAHVDFEAISRATSCDYSQMIPQGELLHRLGIGPRAQKLAEALDAAGDEKRLNTHLSAYRRLTDAAEMGTLFKALALFPTGAPPPPGFDA